VPGPALRIEDGVAVVRVAAIGFLEIEDRMAGGLQAGGELARVTGVDAVVTRVGGHVDFRISDAGLDVLVARIGGNEGGLGRNPRVAVLAIHEAPGGSS